MSGRLATALEAYTGFLEAPKPPLDQLSREHRARIVCNLTAWIASGTYQQKLNESLQKHATTPAEQVASHVAGEFILASYKIINQPIPSSAGLPSHPLPDVTTTQEILEALRRDLREPTRIINEIGRSNQEGLKALSVAFGTISNAYEFVVGDRRYSHGDPEYLPLVMHDALKYVPMKPAAEPDSWAEFIEGASRGASPWLN